MEKPLVTFAVTAVGMQPPLGGPIFLVQLAADGDGQRFDIFFGHADHVMKVGTVSAPAGSISVYRADLVAASIEAAVRTFIFRYVGVQGEMEIMSG